MNLSRNSVRDNWVEIKSKIQNRWIQFNDADIEPLKENLDLLSHKIQNVYGFAKERAELEYNEFRKVLKEQANIQPNPKKVSKSGAEVISPLDDTTASNASKQTERRPDVEVQHVSTPERMDEEALHP